MTTQAHQAAPGWYNDGSGRHRWWDGRMWTNHYADQQRQAQQVQRPAQVPMQHAQQPVQYMPQPSVVVQQGKTYKTSHGFHLIMSIITIGLWLPVWLIVGIYNASKA